MRAPTRPLPSNHPPTPTRQAIPKIFFAPVSVPEVPDPASFPFLSAGDTSSYTRPSGKPGAEENTGGPSTTANPDATPTNPPHHTTNTTTTPTSQPKETPRHHTAPAQPRQNPAARPTDPPTCLSIPLSPRATPDLTLHEHPNYLQGSPTTPASHRSRQTLTGSRYISATATLTCTQPARQHLFLTDRRGRAEPNGPAPHPS